MKKNGFCLLIILLFFNSCFPQNNKVFTQIIMESLDSSLKIYNKFMFYHLQQYNSGWLEDTIIYVNRQYLPASWQDKLVGDIFIIDVDLRKSFKASKDGHLTEYKKIKFNRHINIIDTYIDFLQDTLIVTFRSSDYGKEIIHSKKVLTCAVSDWVIFRYAYSNEKRKWILINSRFCGI